MSIYLKRAVLPSPGRNWAGADRPQPFSTRFASVYRFYVDRTLNGGLKSSRMVLTGVGTTKVAEERQAPSTDSIWQEWLILIHTRPNHVTGDKIRPVDMENTSRSEAPIIQCISFWLRYRDHRPYLRTIQKHWKDTHIVRPANCSHCRR